jgi:hypothetical protein
MQKSIISKNASKHNISSPADLSWVKLKSLDLKVFFFLLSVWQAEDLPILAQGGWGVGADLVDTYIALSASLTLVL